MSNLDRYLRLLNVAFVMQEEGNIYKRPSSFKGSRYTERYAAVVEELMLLYDELNDDEQHEVEKVSRRLFNLSSVYANAS